MVLIDIETKQYRESYSILWFQIPGGWMPLPEIDYISIFNARIKSTFRSRGTESNILLREMQINFIYGKNKVITAYIAKDKDEATKMAKHYAVKLGGKRVLDATQKPFMWMD